MMNTLGYVHVKWFIGDEKTAPLAIADVITHSFLFWFAVTLAGLLISAVFNEPLQRIAPIRRIHHSLDQAKPYLAAILRIGLGIGVIFQLSSSTYLAPEFITNQRWIYMLLVVVLIGLLAKKTLLISGVALAVLYVHAIYEFGLFHALDYVFYVGIVYYLLVSGTRWKETATPALYLFTGLSLSWVGIEKMTMPALAASIVADFGLPTFGFSVEDFVLITAFVELGLAWTFIVGILNRFISIIVTVVFITTAAVFGHTEIVGHTILHTLLIMFLIEGDGAFKTPFQFHRSPLLRYLFVLVNFCILLFGSMWLYVAMGNIGIH
jgi:hypothetical protein